MKTTDTITRTGNLKDMSKLAKTWGVKVEFSHRTAPSQYGRGYDVYMVALPAAEAQQAFWGNLVKNYSENNYAD